jgi:hypothetical protein
MRPLQERPMKTREQMEVEDMALAGELARQLGHDLSNFVYNIFLQIEIWETSSSPPKPDEWRRIQKEGKYMTELLKEWGRFHTRTADETTKFDLHQLIRQMASDVSANALAVELSSSVSAGPLWITGSSLGIRHLLRLLVTSVVPARENAPRTVSIQTESAPTNAIVRILAAGLPPDPRSLVTAACQSLAMRLDATIHREPHADGRHALSVEFPLS